MVLEGEGGGVLASKAQHRVAPESRHSKEVIAPCVDERHGCHGARLVTARAGEIRCRRYYGGGGADTR